MLKQNLVKRWAVGGGIIFIILFWFNASQRPVPSKLERSYELSVENLAPALTLTEPASTLTPPVSISLAAMGGESFSISSSQNSVTREQLFRLLQLVNNSGLLAFHENGDYELTVSIGSELYQGTFSKETLLATTARQSLAKLLSIHATSNNPLKETTHEN